MEINIWIHIENINGDKSNKPEPEAETLPGTLNLSLSKPNRTEAAVSYLIDVFQWNPEVVRVDPR